MRLYAAFDLHSNTNHLAVIGEDGSKVKSRKLPNEELAIISALEPFAGDIQGIAIESTYNWYWLVDGLMDKGFRVHLANPAAIQKYKGLKHSDDVSDAFWLAEMLRLEILPEGYIYPKEDRPVRDLLRKRSHLVRLRSSLIISLQNIIARNCGSKLKVGQIKQLTTDWITPMFKGQNELELTGKTSKALIDQFTRQIQKIERAVEAKASLRDEYKPLRTIPGVGLTLALTIMLETGTIARFHGVGNYSSYCRKVPSKWTSNGKKKSQGNKKNGNKYLAWAFSEAAEFSRRHDDGVKAWYNRKLARTNRMIAHSSLAHKLARAAYCIMRNQTEFDRKKCFS